ncbi:hypothetical protein F5Y10DRAFT_245712 [Nemania abortiva]|nr:hypothetical protein F5Y10DRAFT_245712 [Nemania abortiva]
MAGAPRTHHCECNRRFATPAALAQHKTDSPRHQNSQENTSTQSDVTPAPINAEDVPSNQAGNPVNDDTSLVTSTAVILTAAPSQNQPGSQKNKNKNKKKRNQSWKNQQANGPTQSRAYSPLRRYYNPNWELEYQMSGPDHTQCSPDCDWCGMCAIREPY